VQSVHSAPTKVLAATKHVLGFITVTPIEQDNTLFISEAGRRKGTCIPPIAVESRHTNAIIIQLPSRPLEIARSITALSQQVVAVPQIFL
jgi:hypothetical protein